MTLKNHIKFNMKIISFNLYNLLFYLKRNKKLIGLIWELKLSAIKIKKI